MKRSQFIFIFTLIGYFSFGQCFIPGATLTTQADVTSFAANLNGCTLVSGSLIIDGTNITDLSALDNITEISSDLIIRNTTIVTPNLANNKFFTQITKIGKDLIIENNAELTNIQGFDVLTETSGSCIIRNNAKLNSINDFQSLTLIKKSLIINNNDKLQNIYGFNEVVTIGTQGDNCSTNSFSIFSNSKNAGYLIIYPSALSKLENIYGNFNISGHTTQLHITRFEKLTTICGKFTIENNTDLTQTPTGIFPLLKTVNGNFSFSRNPLGTVANIRRFDINGFYELSFVGGYFKIENNTRGLINLIGFNKLETIIDHFSLIGNQGLVSILGFDVLQNVGVSATIPYRFLLSTNRALADASVFCKFLSTIPSTSALINNNKVGGICNNYQEIVSNCIEVKMKVYLTSITNNPNIQGPPDYLRTLSNFPLSDPYKSSPLNSNFVTVNDPPTSTINQNILTTNGNDAIVDWIFLELRTGQSGTSSVSYTKAALLQLDGDVVGVDGKTPIKFPQSVITNSNGNSYYLTIRHRNHLGLRTENKYALPITTLLDFTDNSVPLHGAAPLYNIPNTNTWVMNGGDANADGSIDAFDTILWETQNGSFDDYTNSADYNLDGSVDAFDAVIWELHNGKFQEID